MEKTISYKRIAVKVGSSTLTHEGTGRLNIRRIESLVRTLSDIKNSGCEVVLVSSGAVAAGAGENMRNTASAIPEKVSKCIKLDREETYELHTLLYKLLEGFE